MTTQTKTQSPGAQKDSATNASAKSESDRPRLTGPATLQHVLGNSALASILQRKCACGGTCEECQGAAELEAHVAVQRKSETYGAVEFGKIPLTRGERLDVATRESFESHFQADLSDVHVHTSSEAAESARGLDALAYTVGRDIYFASGQYAPSSADGLRLLAHEVAHVVQQSAGLTSTIAAKTSSGIRIGAPDDPLEVEAERAAEEFSSGAKAAILTESEHLEKKALVQRRETESRLIIQRQPLPAAGGAGGGGFDPHCLEILGRIMSFLYGGANHTVGTVGVMGPPIHRGVIERYARLLEDPRDLYVHNRTLAQADPDYGSWEGHQLALEGEQRGLRKALDEWFKDCGGGGGVPPEGVKVARTASDWASRPVPDRPRRVAGPEVAPEQRYTLVLQHAGGSNLTSLQAAAAINEELLWATNRLDQLSGEHDLLRQNREEHYVVGWMADVAGGVDLPPMSIWDEPRAKLAAVRAAVGAKDIGGAMISFAEFEKAIAPARQQFLNYKEGTISGAGAVLLGAEVVAVAAAVVFVVAGGALALGVGAGTAAGAGLGTGVTATTAVGGTTGATTTVTVIAATDSVAISNVLSTALATSTQLTVPAELLTAAGEAALWTAEDVEFMSMMQ